jgi:hypothetical protein
MRLIMPEKLAFYFRGPIGGHEIPGAFVTDAKVLLDLPLDILQRVAEELGQYPGFLADGKMDEIIAKVLEDRPGETAPRLARVIRFGEFFFRGKKEGSEALLSRLEKWRQSERRQKPEAESLSDDEWHEIKQRIPLVLKEYPGRLRQQKADRLAEATGLRAESLDLICDLRPVLDENRARIVGLIPLTTLRIIASGVDQFPITFEAVLSAKDVQELFRLAESAVKKLNALGEFAEQVNITIPAVGLTETVETSREGDA